MDLTARVSAAVVRWARNRYPTPQAIIHRHKRARGTTVKSIKVHGLDASSRSIWGGRRRRMTNNTDPLLFLHHETHIDRFLATAPMQCNAFLFVLGDQLVHVV